MTDFTTQDYIRQYVALRDKVEDMESAHKDRLKPFKTAMQTIENVLLDELNKLEADNIKTPEGTCFKSTQTRVHCADKEVFFDWVGENWTNRRTFLTANVAKDTLKDYTENGGDIPPGLDVKYETRVMVRRPS